MTEDGKTIAINSAQVLPRLRAVVEMMGLEKLGFSKEDIGMHSLRSGGAMTMFLSGVATIIIMRIGRWSSEAFMEYIREQVETFTFGVSAKMLLYEHFHTLNEKEEEVKKKKFDDIFVENKSGGDTETVPIEHQIHFSGLSLSFSGLSLS